MVEKETRWIFGTGDPWSFELSGRESLEKNGKFIAYYFKLLSIWYVSEQEAFVTIQCYSKTELKI